MLTLKMVLSMLSMTLESSDALLDALAALFFGVFGVLGVLGAFGSFSLAGCFFLVSRFFLPLGPPLTSSSRPAGKS